MSGGFFRGTSADQDTRFSNKQAKLLKSQKFPPELDHLVDITKVKMDVIRPWIATRATELLGFEDEVLINFIYGLLDGKGVDGKQIQIQLTGFMEKNTGKFMKELWNLLLSAQKNASGVPQQFLDAKEEEMRKKKVESDRITLEIQKKKEKEGREVERGKHIKMDGEANISKSTHAVADPASKHSLPMASSVKSEEERELDSRHGRRTKNGYPESPRTSKSPGSDDHSRSPHRNMPPRARSNSKSFSNSKSYSGDERKSRSVSVSSQSRSHSISAERLYVSPRKQSFSPERRYRSPRRRSISPRRRHSPRSAHSPSRRSRRRSTSRSRRRSPSPFQRRSPHAYRISSSFVRRRSPSPLRRRSPSPKRRRSPSPLRRRPSPLRRRSLVRRRSPSPSRRRSPFKRRSLSPARHRSPSPLRRNSPPRRSPRYRRRTPLYSPRSRATDSQMSPQRRERNHSPYRSRSPIRRSLSRERDSHTNGVELKGHSNEARDKRPPLHQTFNKEVTGADLGPDTSASVSRRLPTSLRSPQRDLRDQEDIHSRITSVPPEDSPVKFEGVDRVQIHSRRNRRSHSLSESPVKQTREKVSRHAPEIKSEEQETFRAREDAHRRTDSFHNKGKDLPTDKGLKKLCANDFSPEVYSLGRTAKDQSPVPRSHVVNVESRKKDPERRDMNIADGHLRRGSPSSEGLEYGPGRVRKESSSPVHANERNHSTKKHAREVSSFEERKNAREVSSFEERKNNEQTVKNACLDGHEFNDEKRPKHDEHKESHFGKILGTKSKRKVDKNLGNIDSGTEDTDTNKYQNNKKRSHRKSSRHKKDDDDTESESEIDDRKEAKRRRKDEKRTRKEERRRKREEKHHRRLERRERKLKAKSLDTVALPSDIENNLNDSDDTDGDAAIRKNSAARDAEESESEQKKLEIELRKKALESLRAKKAISH